ncbi:sigma-54-dependent Fis family transcriptional regulator, partial [Burkholderia pseudomallei]
MPHALIVEDDPNSLSGLTALLGADGFSVDTATSLAEARGALARSIPDVVLVDLNLPDGSGFDLLQNLPHPPPNGSPPAYVLTCHPSVATPLHARPAATRAYPLKPLASPGSRP